MEPVIECILRILDVVLDELDHDVDRVDFTQLINKESEHCDQIRAEITKFKDVRDGERCDYDGVKLKLEHWNQKLRGLVDKVSMDVEVQHIISLQTNSDLSLSLEERNFLKVKKEKRIKDLKVKIYRLIIKLDEIIMSFDQMMEDDSLEVNDEVMDEQSHIFDAIELRYNAAINKSNNGKSDEISVKIVGDEKEKDNVMEHENHIKEEYSNQHGDDRVDNSIIISNQESQAEINQQSPLKENKMTKEAEMIPDVRETKPVTKDYPKVTHPPIDVEQLVWNRFKYPVPNGEFPDMEIGCIVSSCKDTLKDRENVMITTRTIDDIPMKLDITFEILSNIIQIEPAGFDVEFNNEYPWRISIPYQMIRNASKEVVIVCHDITTGTNMILETQELIFDDIKEGGFKLAEASLPSPSCICVVVSKRKIEKFKIDKRGNKFVSNIDPRVVLTMPQNSVKINVNFEMSVLQIESGQLNELLSKISLNNLYSMSPIVEIKSDYPRNFLKTVSLQIPIPNIPVHSGRGRAVSARQQTSEKMIKRSKSAITRQVSSDEDPVIKVGVFNNQDNLWRMTNNLNFAVNKNKDAVEIDIQNLNQQKLVVVRCDENFNDDHLHKSIETINKGFETRVIQFIIRQHTNEPNRIVIVTSTPNRMDKIQKVLTQENFSEETSLLSSEFTIQERCKLMITCKGNLEISGRKVLTHRYNSQLPNRKEFWVTEIDKFAQKSKDFYQGFVVISEAQSNNVNKLWEAVINIPKIDPGIKKNQKSINDFDFHATDIINKHYLRFLSQQLGKDWMTLGKSLKVAEVTIRRISNNPSIDGQTMAYECLLKWIKNATVYSNKVIVMEKALRSIGRYDLVQDLAKRVMSDK